MQNGQSFKLTVLYILSLGVSFTCTRLVILFIIYREFLVWKYVHNVIKVQFINLRNKYKANIYKHKTFIVPT